MPITGRRDTPYILGRCLPPPTEVKAQNYHYEPCPSEVSNPIDGLGFMHVLLMPGEHFDSFWTNQVPKKLQKELKYKVGSKTPIIGWGLYIVESPNWHALTVLTIVTAIICLIIALVYSIVMKDASGGFTVGSFFLGVLTLFIALASTVILASV